MRLLKLQDNGEFSLTEFFGGNIPSYAILSHTWGAEEVTFKDLTEDIGKSKSGYQKIRFCGKQAATDGLEYFWVDTCCINKSNSLELSEAINSMFRWYRNAAKCYVFLADVSVGNPDGNGRFSRFKWEPAFRKSRWFTRGWTLQELIAPASVEFFSLEGKRLGNKKSLERQVHEITRIPIPALYGIPLSQYDVATRMTWAAHRSTIRSEDSAYCLLGIFDIHMPLIYGEGEEKASNRLQSEIEKASEGRPVVSREPLTYHPLKDSEVRILILSPGNEGAGIKAHIKVANLKDLKPPKYDALSYVWGHEPAIHPIDVGNERFLLRPNLFHALQRIRNREHLLNLWVDSVCIDQSNDSEKTAQVRRMADIYRKAQNVWIWLGEEDLTSKIAMGFISQIIDPDFQWNGLWWEQSGFTALDHILGRPWFRRGWVLQEAAFSANSIIFCGDRQVHMDDFANAVSLVRARLSKTSSYFTPTRKNVPFSGFLPNFRDSSAIRLLDTIQGCFSRSEDGTTLNHRMTLEALVDLGIFYETTDQRDAIYALLSLANDADSPSQPDSSDAIVPDYSKNPLDVFADFILHCCRRSGSLDIICRPWAPVSPSTAYAADQGYRVDQALQMNAPSWISSRDCLPFGNPSWRMTRRLHGDPLVGSYHKRIYNAHYNTKPQVDIGRNSGSNTCDGSLYAKGIILGEITQRSTRMADAIITQECLDILGTISRDQHSNLVSLPDVIWHTLCADRNDRGERAPLDFQSAMLHILQLSSKDLTTTDLPNLVKTMSSIDVEEILDTELPGLVKEFLDVARDIVWNRRTFRGKGTDSNTSPIAGLIPQSAKVGDLVCVLYGCSVPVVLRKQLGKFSKHCWELISEAYVHGFMDGKGIYSLSPAALESAEITFEIR